MQLQYNISEKGSKEFLNQYVIKVQRVMIKVISKRSRTLKQLRRGQNRQKAETQEEV